MLKHAVDQPRGEGEQVVVVFSNRYLYTPPDFVIDNIYLGSEDSATYLTELEQLGIKSVLVVGRGLHTPFPDHIRYK
jgi:hypothetical protein